MTTYPVPYRPLTAEDVREDIKTWTERDMMFGAILTKLFATLDAARGVPIPGFTEAVCSSCQSTWSGISITQPILPPNCARCGKPCAGGHMLLPVVAAKEVQVPVPPPTNTDGNYFQVHAAPRADAVRASPQGARPRAPAPLECPGEA